MSEIATTQEVFSLDRGEIVLQMPATISAADYEDIKEWLAILQRKLGRCVTKDSEDDERIET
jgi:hypothetical protein